jgi:hypothetical protein
MRSITMLVCTTLLVTAAGCAGHRSRSASSPAALKSELPIPPSRAPAEFGNFVRTREPQLQFCYQDTRASSPSLAGSATVAVTVAPDGNVVTADIVRRSWSGKGADVVESCLLSRVRSWKFPSSDSEAERQTMSFAVIFTR